MPTPPPASTSESGSETQLPGPSAREIAQFAAMVAISLLACLVPVRWDAVLARAVDHVTKSLFPGRVRRVAARMRKVMGDRLGQRDENELARHWQQNKFEIQIGQLRGVWRNVPPRIEVVGREHITSGLEKGNGVILWVMATGGPLIYKQGLALSGIPFVHLSSAMHGARRKSTFGVGTVAPFRRRAEDRFIRERVSIPLDGSLNYLVGLKQRLASNQCITIHGEYRGRQNVRAPLFGYSADFALGAPSLASRGGAELVTLHVERLGAAHYRVVIAEPITADAGDRKEFARYAVRAFASRLEERIESHPELWDGWGDPPPLYPPGES